MENIKTVDGYFLVLGNSVNKDYSNIKVIKTTVIPNVGDIIAFKNKVVRKVTGKMINYTQVEDYNELDDPDRGCEMIHIFTEKY